MTNYKHLSKGLVFLFVLGSAANAIANKSLDELNFQPLSPLKWNDSYYEVFSKLCTMEGITSFYFNKEEQGRYAKDKILEDNPPNDGGPYPSNFERVGKENACNGEFIKAVFPRSHGNTIVVNTPDGEIIAGQAELKASPLVIAGISFTVTVKFGSHYSGNTEDHGVGTGLGYYEFRRTSGTPLDTITLPSHYWSGPTPLITKRGLPGVAIPNNDRHQRVGTDEPLRTSFFISSVTLEANKEETGLDRDGWIKAADTIISGVRNKYSDIPFVAVGDRKAQKKLKKLKDGSCWLNEEKNINNVQRMERLMCKGSDVLEYLDIRINAGSQSATIEYVLPESYTNEYYRLFKDKYVNSVTNEGVDKL